MKLLLLLKKILKPKKWSISLLWCPSQIERTIHYEGLEIVFYCRWRWNDPWRFSVIVEEDVWVEDYDIPHFRDYEYYNLMTWIDMREEEILKKAVKEYHVREIE